MRLFIDCTSNADEKRRLEELCSKEGSDVYIKYILEEHLSILDILNYFPSCQPDVAMFIGKFHCHVQGFMFCFVNLEFLPSLMPRFYSICSSPLDDARSITFVYSVLNFQLKNGRTYERAGVCTNWLNKLELGSKVNNYSSRINRIYPRNSF